jgi:hypothetical protein
MRGVSGWTPTGNLFYVVIDEQEGLSAALNQAGRFQYDLMH